MICSIIAALLIVINLDTETAALTAITVLVAGSISSWLSSLLVYGFGEIVEKVTEIAKNTRPNAENTESPELMAKEKLVGGLVVEESFSYETLDL